MNDIILDVKNLKVHFDTDDGVVKAVDGVDFTLRRNSTLGIVGESGCGKSVTAFSILQLITKPGHLVDGQMLFYGADANDSDIPIDLAAMHPRGSEIRQYRGNVISMIFQEPMNSLSPVYTIGQQIIELIQEHKPMSNQMARQHAIEMLRRVGIPHPERNVDSYTFQLSGGMRQRAMIAMALALNPTILIADEPTTALDVTTQAQILDLMVELREQYDSAIILITHDLGVVAEACDEVVVMYLGEVVEQADVDSLFFDPQHPYTQALLRSIPNLDDDDIGQRLDPIEGSVPSPFNRPTGCLFHDRCTEFMPGRCDKIHPQLRTLPDGRRVRCLLYDGEEVS
ncbi:MAG: ABC transporter ATP-binding protein [Aggregatilineales bacterium]